MPGDVHGPVDDDDVTSSLACRYGRAAGDDHVIGRRRRAAGSDQEDGQGDDQGTHSVAEVHPIAPRCGCAQHRMRSARPQHVL
jgi:hypothetical protein